jgi:hypothetical protein
MYDYRPVSPSPILPGWPTVPPWAQPLFFPGYDGRPVIWT